MKTVLIWMALIAVVAASCREEIKEIGPVQSKLEGIKGTWEVKRVIMNDTTATVPEPADITDYFQSASRMPSIVFNISDFTYLSDPTGVAYDFFGSGGKWAFDDPGYPKKILFTPTGGVPFVMGLSAPIREIDPSLRIQKYVYCDSAKTDFKFAYQLELIRR